MSTTSNPNRCRPRHPLQYPEREILIWPPLLIADPVLKKVKIAREYNGRHGGRGRARLLARVLKVQFWYNNASTVGGGGGGGRENVPLENLWSLRYFISVSVPSSFEMFQTHLALWVCAAMFLYLTTTFSFSQVHHQIDQNLKCIIIMRNEAISFQIY